MLFFPIGCLLLVLFILIFPVLFLLLFFDVVTFSFEKLGISPTIAFLLLFLTLIGSLVNIPLTRRKIEYVTELPFGWFEVPRVKESGLAINLGGAIIPVGISFYLLTRVPLWSALAATGLMIIICKLLAKPVPAKGIAISMFVPPIFAALFSILLASEYAAPCAYISGVLGTIVGADLLNIKKARRLNSGIISIGGAGVFDGIFLVGIVSVFLTALLK